MRVKTKKGLTILQVSPHTLIQFNSITGRDSLYNFGFVGMLFLG